MRLQAKHITLSVGDRILLQDFSVDMESGQTWVVLGANGSGKTTLLHTLAGLSPPAAGEILLNDKSLETIGHRERARQLAILFQDYESVFPGPVLETVLAARYPFAGWHQLLGDDADDRQIAMSALEHLDLDEFANRNMLTLSGGERRRVQIAALLAQTAPVRLLDEPTNHLDLRHQVEVLSHVCASNNNFIPGNEHPLLNIIVLHDINQAMAYGSHAILLFPDGTGTSGAIGDIVDKNILERLYQCRLQEVAAGQRTIYLPA